MRILLNADIGERGADHPADRELMRYLDIANIACGGHAGDADSVAAFRALAKEHGVEVSAHLSYPDRRTFGRVAMNIPFEELRRSLDAQMDLMPDVPLVKLHGALYNEACSDRALAEQLTGWLAGRGVSCIITLHDGEIARACRRARIQVLAEAFTDRRYIFHPGNGRLSLMDRARAAAVITDISEALEQVRVLVEEEEVHAYVEDEARLSAAGVFHVGVDTICVHSDSPIALDVARGAAQLLRRDANRGQ